MNDIKLKDIIPPRGMLMSYEQSQEYTRKKIQELKEEGRITEDETERLIGIWCKEE